MSSPDVPRPRLSVAMITLNEADRIARTLAELRDIADEVVILDSGSTDGTKQIALACGATVHETDWPGFGKQKTRALEACSGEWILSLDADEYPDDELRQALVELPAAADCKDDAYEVDRLTEYVGDFVRHAWSPDWLTRVVKNGHGKFTDSLVHEKMLVEGRVGRLPGKLLHFSYDDLDDHFTKLKKYAHLSAEDMRRRGKRFRTTDLLFRPVFAFLQRYILKLGILDGVRGILVAGATAKACFMKYAFLYELERRPPEN